MFSIASDKSCRKHAVAVLIDVGTGDISWFDAHVAAQGVRGAGTLIE